RIHGDDVVAGAQQFPHDPVRGFVRIRRRADHRDCLRVRQKRPDLLRRRIAVGHPAILVDHAAGETTCVDAIVGSGMMNHAAKYAITPITTQPGTIVRIAHPTRTAVEATVRYSAMPPPQTALLLT